MLSDVEQMIIDNAADTSDRPANAADEQPAETSHGDQAPADADEPNPEVTAD